MDPWVNVPNIFTSEHFNPQNFPFIHVCRHIRNSDLATTLAMCKPIDVSWKVVKVFSAPTTVNTALLSDCGEPCLCRSDISKAY